MAGFPASSSDFGERLMRRRIAAQQAVQGARLRVRWQSGGVAEQRPSRAVFYRAAPMGFDVKWRYQRQ